MFSFNRLKKKSFTLCFIVFIFTSVHRFPLVNCGSNFERYFLNGNTIKKSVCYIKLVPLPIVKPGSDEYRSRYHGYRENTQISIR